MLIYGSMLCPDCVKCRQELDEAGVCYEYRDFSENLQYLKEFLALRDQEPIFEASRKNGKIGIPCLVTPEGTVTLSWEEFLPEKEET